MENYTKTDVINALLSIDGSSRKRPLVDQRSYLIGILAYKFNMTEHAIAKATGFKREKVHYNKKLSVQFCNDTLYKENIYVYAQLFPYSFNKMMSQSKRNEKVILTLEPSRHAKLKAAGAILGHSNIAITINLFIDKALQLWEK
jgi:hypothetical protein